MKCNFFLTSNIKHPFFTSWAILLLLTVDHVAFVKTITDNCDEAGLWKRSRFNPLDEKDGLRDPKNVRFLIRVKTNATQWPPPIIVVLLIGKEYR